MLFIGKTTMGEARVLSAIPPLGRFFTQEAGLYMFSNPVTTDGVITAMKAFGVLDDRDFEIFRKERLSNSSISHFLFVMVFRFDAQSESYQLIHGPERITHTQSSPAVIGGLSWSVRGGDRIGALIPASCAFDPIISPFPCPSRINLKADSNMSCSSALHYSVYVNDMNTARFERIPAREFVEEQVMLNMEAVIEPVGKFPSLLPPPFFSADPSHLSSPPPIGINC